MTKWVSGMGVGYFFQDSGFFLTSQNVQILFTQIVFQQNDGWNMINQIYNMFFTPMSFTKLLVFHVRLEHRILTYFSCYCQMNLSTNKKRSSCCMRELMANGFLRGRPGFRLFFWYLHLSSWWFQIFFIVSPIWGRFPFWLIFFKGVETTN